MGIHLSTVKDIFKIAEPIAKPFLPGGVGSVLDQVEHTINNDGGSADIEHLAQAILQINERLKAVEAKLGI